ncbi:MAG: hypothetical protein HOV80_18145 [Polyangiaceae bacterium]|nr:hypothetical protein [Polyangiaceae bacterium]
MFGLDISELMILLVVGIVVVGPKRLPEMMRKAGGYVAKLRRLSTNLRAQSGIDRILREEGLDKEIRELRALRESLSKQAMLDGLVNAVNKPAPSKPLPPKPTPALPAAPKPVAALAPGSTADKTAENADAKAETETKAADAATSAPEPNATADASATATEEAKPSTVSPEAAALIKPAEGTIARGESVTTAEPTVKNPFRSPREREYPPYGPDHYDAMPDDLEEDELEAPPESEAPAPATEVAS